MASCGEPGICFIEAKFIENQQWKTAGVWAGVHKATYKILTKFLRNSFEIPMKFLQIFIRNFYEILTKYL
jgi:hypothetical protein